MTLKSKVRDFFISKGATQRDVAKRLQISDAAISAKIKGQNSKFTLEEVAEIMDMFEMSADEAFDIFMKRGDEDARKADAS